MSGWGDTGSTEEVEVGRQVARFHWLPVEGRERAIAGLAVADMPAGGFRLGQQLRYTSVLTGDADDWLNLCETIVSAVGGRFQITCMLCRQALGDCDCADERRPVPLFPEVVEVFEFEETEEPPDDEPGAAEPDLDDDEVPW